MTSRYKRQCNNNDGEKIECFEAEEVLQTFKNFIEDFDIERTEKLKLEEENILLKETNNIYKEKLKSQNNLVVGGGNSNKKLNEFINEIVKIKMRRCNITEADLINHRNKILMEIEK